MVEIWQGVLKVARVGVRDNFFELGGHSLLAMQVIAKMNKALSKEFMVRDLFSNPTIMEMSAVLEVSRAGGQNFPEGVAPQIRLDPRFSARLTALGLGTTGVPLFLFPGGDGNILVFREFALELARKRPVVILQPAGIDGRTKPSEELTKVAGEYADLIFRSSGEEVIHLAGFCAGGLIALEVARLLKERGRTVGAVCLIDSFLPPQGKKRGAGEVVLAKLNKHIRLVKERGLWTHLKVVAGQQYRKWWTRTLVAFCNGLLRAGLGVPLPLRERWLMQIQAGMFAKCALGAYHDRVIFVWATQDPEWAHLRYEKKSSEGRALEIRRAMEAWQRVCRGPVESYAVTGDHVSMLQGELATRTAGQVNEILQQLEPLKHSSKNVRTMP
jgi:thioesterase domain-containing protein